ncbi:hypothetical protein OJ253_3748 [Cryptosporidium canis]|uniref:Uncharacterized protein n=1 Tax=Cryptosporidium canis TaxID=195482 RepID=A0A9D5DDL9_9CRYT|nr:hypothetical protein OJ253_3748 [Cryptosporidium canis]
MGLFCVFLGPRGGAELVGDARLVLGAGPEMEQDSATPGQGSLGGRQASGSGIIGSLSSLPEVIKAFQDGPNADFSARCQDYWSDHLKYLISKYKSSGQEFQTPGPVIQMEEIIRYLSGTTTNDNNTMIRVRLKYALDPGSKRILGFDPVISCIPDVRVSRPSQDRIKLRDINHTFRRIFKAIKKFNTSQETTRDLTTKHIRHLDLLIHYDDCPVIWKSMPFHIYRNDTLHLEKCILNSKFSKKIQSILSNSTEIHQVLPQLTNAKHSSSSDQGLLETQDQPSNNLTSYLLLFSTSPTLLQGSHHDTSYSSSTLEPLLLSQNGLCLKDLITSSLIHANLPSRTACRIINEFVSQITLHTPLQGVSCFGTIQCHIPCFFEDNPIFPSILDKLRKNDPAKIFNHLHCICQFSPSGSPGLILSISSHENSWDLPSIPYPITLSTTRSGISRTTLSSSLEDTQTLTDLTSPVTFTTPSRISHKSSPIKSLSLTPTKYPATIGPSSWRKLHNVIPTSSAEKNPPPFRTGYLIPYPASSPSISLESDPGPTDSECSCSQRKQPMRLFSLHLPSTGTMIFQNTRSFHSQQFYDLPFKKNNLFFRFSNPADILIGVNSILENPHISSNISRIISNFAQYCLSDDGITQYFTTLLSELGQWDLLTHLDENTTHSQINSTEIPFLPKDNLQTIKSKVEACLRY